MISKWNNGWVMVDNHGQGDRGIIKGQPVNGASQFSQTTDTLSPRPPFSLIVFLPPSLSKWHFQQIEMPKVVDNWCHRLLFRRKHKKCSGQCKNKHKKSNGQWMKLVRKKKQKWEKKDLHYLSDWYRFMASIIIRHNKAGNWIGMLLLPCTAFSD